MGLICSLTIRLDAYLLYPKRKTKSTAKKLDLGRNSNANELLQVQAHIWNHIFNFINSISLKCTIQLGIPDIIHKHGKPMTLDELTNALPIGNAKAPFVYRLMRILMRSGFFIEAKISQHDDEEGYMLTTSSKLLLKDEPFSLTPCLILPWWIHGTTLATGCKTTVMWIPSRLVTSEA